MKYTSIIEKLLCLYNILISSWIDIVILSITLILGYLLIRKKISKGLGITFLSAIYTLFLGYTIYNRYNNLSIIFNSIIDNFFTTIYFPSIYVYLFILIAINIIFIISLLNKYLSNIYKVLTGICFGLINFIFIIILEIIGKNNIDVLSKLSLFGNNDLITMLELSITIFIIWLISLIAVYIINKLTEIITNHGYNKELKDQPANIIEPILEINTNNIQQEINNNQPEETITSFLPNNIINNSIAPIVTQEPIINTNNINNNFNINEYVYPKQELKPVNNPIMDKIIKNELPVIEEQPKNNTYTLNDYKTFNNMLKDIKEFTQSNTINIDKNLEYRLITKYSTEKYNMFKNMLKNYSN